MLFRRRRPKSDDEGAEPGPPPAVPSSREPEPVEPGPASPAPVAETPAPAPPLLPPPLPAPPPSRADPGARAGVFQRCFVCQSPLDHGTCPKCRLTWVE